MCLKMYILVVAAFIVIIEANPQPPRSLEPYHYAYYPAIIEELRQIMGEMSSCFDTNTRSLMDKLKPAYKEYAMELGHDVLENYLKHMTNAFVRRDVSPTPSTPADLLDALQKNMDNIRKCIDQSLANTVSVVNENKLQPILATVGDQLNRVSKAFDDLTAPAPPKDTMR